MAVVGALVKHINRHTSTTRPLARLPTIETHYRLPPNSSRFLVDDTPPLSSCYDELLPTGHAECGRHRRRARALDSTCATLVTLSVCARAPIGHHNHGTAERACCNSYAYATRHSLTSGGPGSTDHSPTGHWRLPAVALLHESCCRCRFYHRKNFKLRKAQTRRLCRTLCNKIIHVTFIARITIDVCIRYITFFIRD